MTATELLAAVQAAGAEICRDGDDLFLETAGRLAPELITHLRECKCACLVIDAQGAYCVACRKRPGQPAPVPCTEPAPLSSRRHTHTRGLCSNGAKSWEVSIGD
jgi:hypothetical protein